jgi:hypothetical protein
MLILNLVNELKFTIHGGANLSYLFYSKNLGDSQQENYSREVLTASK